MNKSAKTKKPNRIHSSETCYSKFRNRVSPLLSWSILILGLSLSGCHSQEWKDEARRAEEGAEKLNNRPYEYTWRKMGRLEREASELKQEVQRLLADRDGDEEAIEILEESLQRTQDLLYETEVALRECQETLEGREIALKKTERARDDIRKRLEDTKDLLMAIALELKEKERDLESAEIACEKSEQALEEGICAMQEREYALLENLKELQRKQEEYMRLISPTDPNDPLNQEEQFNMAMEARLDKQTANKEKFKRLLEEEQSKPEHDPFFRQELRRLAKEFEQAKKEAMERQRVKQERQEEPKKKDQKLSSLPDNNPGATGTTF